MDVGKISEKGFLVGGAGYIFNHLALSRLTAYAVKDYPSKYDRLYAPPYVLGLTREIRLRNERKKLLKRRHEAMSGSERVGANMSKSVEEEARADSDSLEKWKGLVHNSTQCVLINGSADAHIYPATYGSTGLGGGAGSDDLVSMGAGLSVRLIDMCVTLLSGEHTCHHRYDPYVHSLHTTYLNVSSCYLHPSYLYLIFICTPAITPYRDASSTAQISSSRASYATRDRTLGCSALGCVMSSSKAAIWTSI